MLRSSPEGCPFKDHHTSARGWSLGRLCKNQVGYKGLTGERPPIFVQRPDKPASDCPCFSVVLELVKDIFGRSCSCQVLWGLKRASFLAGASLLPLAPLGSKLKEGSYRQSRGQGQRERGQGCQFATQPLQLTSATQNMSL